MRFGACLASAAMTSLFAVRPLLSLCNPHTIASADRLSLREKGKNEKGKEKIEEKMRGDG